jgi:hypothetical protein
LLHEWLQTGSAGNLECVKSKKTKRQYRVGNRREYHAALVKRGSLTVWLDGAALTGWFHLQKSGRQKSGRQGASRLYSDVAIEAVDVAIEAVLVLKAVYRLPLRAAQGFAHGVLNLMGLSLPVPHFSTLSRRQVGLESGPLRGSHGETLPQPLHLVNHCTW